MVKRRCLMKTNVIVAVLAIVVLLLLALFLNSGMLYQGTNSTTTVSQNYTASTSVPATTTTSAQLPHFSLTGWNVAINHHTGNVDMVFNYTTTSPVLVYIFDNAIKPGNGNFDDYYESYGSWQLRYSVMLNDTQGKSNLSMTARPLAGNYTMVAYSVDNNGDPAKAVWNRTFAFSGPHLELGNASVSWNTTGASGVYWYQPTFLASSVRNTGDLPTYGYWLRGWVNNTPIFFLDGSFQGWIPVGGPWPINITATAGVYREPGNYSLHVELVSDYDKTVLVSQWNGFTQIS